MPGKVQRKCYSALVAVRPEFSVAAFVDHEGVRAGREDLEGLQEFDEGVALVLGQRVEGLALSESLAVVGFDGFAGGSELAVVHERAALVVEAP